MRSSMPLRLLLATLLAGLALGGVAYARQCEREIPAVDAPPPSVLIVMDASRSMSKPAGDGRTRLQAAKAALRTLVEGLPEGARVGLRLYGHRVSASTRAVGCRDTELVAPVGKLDRRALAAQIDSYRAVGYTPIGRALRAAAADLPAEGVSSIVLVSDGGDNCAPPSPCAVAGQIARRGTDLSVQAIGFQVSGRARAQLRCIAERGRGVYRDAADADELAVALRALAARGTRTFALRGTRIAGGAGERDATPIASGRFLDRIAPGDERWYSIALRRGQRLAASGALILVCPPDTGVTASIGTVLQMDVLDRAGATPDVTAAAPNLFTGDISVESVGLLTAPIAAAARAPAGDVRMLRVAFDADPNGGLARALDGAAVPLQLDVNVLGRNTEDRSAASARDAGGRFGVAASVAVIVGCLLFGVIGGAAARVRRSRGAR
jgi:Mg-chelatase subunit ChlD